LFEKRHSSDYDDFAYYDIETLEKLYPQAIEFIENIEKLSPLSTFLLDLIYLPVFIHTLL